MNVHPEYVMRKLKTIASPSAFWRALTLITHSMIPFIALTSLLAVPESDRILYDVIFWLLLFFWNLHLLFVCRFFYRLERISRQIGGVK